MSDPQQDPAIRGATEEQRASEADVTPITPDDRGPSPERQVELRAAYEANVAARRPPYSRVRLHSRGELDWVMRERGWSGAFDAYTVKYWLMPGNQPYERADLRGVNLSHVPLSGVLLRLADLSGANLVYADLRGAQLTDARLCGAELGGVNLHQAMLNFADLSQAHLREANLAHSNLRYANLSGAHLSSADLRHTVLHGALVDRATVLADARLDAGTQLGDVLWDRTALARVDWGQAPRLGDEDAIKGATTRQQRITALTNAARAYRGLAQTLQAQGLAAPALRYRTHQNRLERQTLFWQGKLGAWLFSWLLNVVSGYGDRPGRAVAWYLAVVSCFAAAYDAITNGLPGFVTSQSTHLHWYEALVLSISSFHGRGLFPSTLSLGDPVAMVAAAEAIIGLFIELVFIATFTQRFFGAR